MCSDIVAEEFAGKNLLLLGKSGEEIAFNLYDKLLEGEKLLENGIITKEEFESIKKNYELKEEKQTINNGLTLKKEEKPKDVEKKVSKPRTSKPRTKKEDKKEE